MDIVKNIMLIILAYLAGSFPTGVLISKKFFQKDLRDFGSGNTGTTNTFRVLGFWPGVVVLTVDILKGTLGAALPLIFGIGPKYLVLVYGLASIFGHSFSIFLNMKGGKAVATSAGVLLAYNWSFFLIAITVFGIILLLTSMVSLTSMVAMVIVTGISFFYHDAILTTVAAIVLIFIIWRHQPNIRRIKNGTESVVPFGLYHHYLNKKKD
ncbi:membrane protein [Amylolactobacillus amylotrophicus DSM 20534]|uniref:Glycerol-3-phosphate acyltransferase n=3 Tax=Amylolactobacillus TaxID=2767876 RepID=A0A0R1YLR2_9LACO|nr:membrane protein [Amylolactobacillus amylotrophicus DSM 20534]KRM42821.1 membrane protein [Amylolactobacillus amylophilus DSM 20533 = JCM 1125]GED79684.1 glycerol-3-phosphate acyltransferase 2 [Amylolactobacillus amylophilus]